MEKELLMPYTHILKAPSKEKRKSIPMAFNFWLDIPKEKAKFISDYVYMIHTASLALEEWTGADKNQEQNSQYFYEDLTEGKFTLPIIHAAKQNGGEAVLGILFVVINQYFYKLKIFIGLFYIENFGGNPELSAILDEMASNI
ncbi:unnamed protein product [Leptidea sinapis]|uniref:Uncharacterized protein n=1 Tax=Leptidea sinapis TaxID=189913 RepID=A0A5E4QP62_9NEOP|nr:unnamed protein product [Leptidea sinapis]